MPVDFSVKRVPDEVARRLRERAQRNHRSLQRELLCILEASALSEAGPDRVAEPVPLPYAKSAPGRTPGRRRRKADRLTLDELWERARRLGDPIPDEPAASVIRQDRDERSRH